MAPAWSPGLLGTAPCSRSVKKVNTGIGRVNENLNEHVLADNRVKKQIYSDRNTKVDVTVRTKCPKRPSDDWSSILSDNTGKFGGICLAYQIRFISSHSQLLP